VLGTSFVVRQYAEDSVVTVAVREGKVAVGSAIVTPHRLVEVGASGVAHFHDAAPSQFTFASGVLTLGVQTLAQAIPELNRWYDADIRLANDAIGTQQVKGKFVAGSLADLAEILELTFDVRVVRDGRTLTLYPTTK
jgi:ferric-dicitrate binding protein FerR (iron transport regulator)